MEYKKTIILLALVVFLLSIAGVSASEIDNTIASENANTIELSTDNDIKDNLQTSEENEALASTDYDEVLSAQTDTEVLGEGSAKYSDLAQEIGQPGNITLIHKNYTYDGGEPITISEDNKVIDGNGAVIDMNGSTYLQAFYVSASGVTIKNLTIKNANYDGYGGAIYFESTGTVTNCNFTNNSATYEGGAVYFRNVGTVSNCNFTDNSASSMGGAVFFRNVGEVSNCNFVDNKATGDYSKGGAVYFYSNGTVSNCNFTDNTAEYGGAVYFFNNGNVTNCNFVDNKATGDYSNGGAVFFNREGTVTNCNFTNNSATYEGGAIFFVNTGTVSNCNFTGNTASRDGGAIMFVSTGEVSNCNFTGNTADKGGAINMGSGSVSNCNFTDNKATGTGDYDGGGAVYFYDDSSVSNCNFTGNTASGDGGAIWMYSGSVENCNFTGNTASGDGGAVYFYQGTGSVTNCNFTDNKATRNGGAVYFSSNGDVTNCNFTNNTATQNGGAVYFVDDSTGNIINCNFTNNSISGKGGAISMGSGTVSNCNFTDNKATGTNSWGGAVYFRGGQGTVTNCNFADNTATYGGAVYFFNTGNVTNCNFTNNTATSQGGAIRFSSTGTVSNCNFTDNTATYYGGAVCFLDQGTVSNCNFTDNEAYLGGAVFFMNTGNVSNCNFTDNTASGDGGAVYFWNQGTVTNCNFTGNNATTGSAIYFLSTLAIKTVSNSRFLNNRANAEALEITKNDNNITITFTGRNNLLNAIYSSNDAKVTFTNVTYWGATGITTVSAKLSGSNKAAGQNITVKGVVNGKIIDKINGTDENGEIVLDDAGDYWIIVSHKGDLYYTEIAETLFTNMKLYANVTSLTTNNKTVNITAKSNIFSEVMPGKLLFILPNGTQIEATYGDNGTWWAEHTFDAYGEYKINATYVGLDNVTINNGTITINKVNSTITLDNIVLDYGETKNVTVTTTGATGITAKIDGNDVTVINNYTIQIPVLDAGSYNLTVTTIPDDDHNPVTKEVNITVNKVNSTLTVNDIVFDYGSSGSTVVSLTGADGVNATVVGQPKAVVKVNGTNITVSGLDAGTYTLTVTTIADKNHNNITKNTTMTVNKVNSTLTLDDVVLDYGESKNITVTTEGATGITAKIDGVNVTVNDYIIPISGLGAGNYTLTVTTIADKNHNPVTKEAKITVNKVESTLTVGDIVFDYGGEGSGDVSFTGASEVIANVVNQPSAVVSVSGNKISVSGLGAGNYTLNVTTVPDENHTAVTETAGITVNKVNSTLTLDDVVLDYGESKNITVTTTGATGITAKIDGVNVTVNGYTIPISGLGAGNYTLSVTTIPDENHNPVTVTSKITVNKVESTLTVGDIVFDYDGEGSGDVSFTGASEVTANIINQPKAVVSVSGNKISVSGLGAGNYTLNVTTVPDENHTAVTETATITVNKINSTLTLDDVELDYGDSKNVTVTTEGATGITAKIDGVNVTVNGYTIPISGLGAGNYTLSVTTIPDENHNPVTVTSKITVNKIESTLTVGDIVFDYDGEGSGDVSFTGASEVTANIINQPKAVVSVSGNKISVSGLGAESYTLNVTTVPDENHTAVTETATITVNKVNSTLTLDDVELDYGDSKNVTVTTEGATGITAKIDGVNVTVNGYTIPISGLGAGNYTLTVTTIADANHNNITKNATITVNKVNATLTVNDVVLDYGETKNITVTTEGATGITAKIDGVNVTVSNYTISISGLGAGNYTLTVTTIADKNHNPVTKEVNITVNKLSTEIILANETLDLKVGDEVPVLANLTPAGAGDLTFTSSDEDLVFVEDNVTIVANSQGQAIITVSFAGNENYTAAENKTITVNVALNDASVSVENDTLNLKVDETCTINATIEPDTIMLHIKYTSSNESVVTVDKNGIVTAVGEGRAIITLEVGDDEIYAKKSTTVTVTVSKINTTADVSIPENIDVGDNVTVDVKLPSDATGNVTLKVDGKVIDNVQVTNGTASVKLPALGAGKHTVEVTYSGDDKYKPASKASTINVKKLSTKLSAGDVKVTYSLNKYLLITLKDGEGNPLADVKITVNLNGAKVYTTDSKGQVKIIVGKMVPKTYTAKITFAGNNKYLGSTASSKVVVQKANVRITALNKVYKSSVKVKLYPVILKDFTGKVLKNVVVSLKVNGKTYSAKTDANGKAIFKITQLTKKGTYNAVITFKGNNYYNKVVKKATIKVNSVWQVVQKGSKNSALVKKIQVALIKHGYYRNAQGNHLKIDGIYWDYTVLAVKKFQMNNHLKVTGKVDELTAKKLGII